VEDTCRRVEAAIKAPLDKVRGEAINLGSGEAVSIMNIAQMILKEMGKPDDLIVYLSDRPGQVDYHISSTEKAATLLGVSSGRPFLEGLRQTIDWYVNNRDWWREIEWMKHVKILTKTGQKELH